MNFHKSFYIALFFLMMPLASSYSQDLSQIKHTIDSAYPDQVRTYTVQLPNSYDDQSTFRYPVLYVLDGESNLDYTVAVTSYLAENALIPEMIVVGLDAGATRNIDYMPAFDANNSTSSGADLFLDYLEKELIPEVEESYRTAPLRLISGHSMGGILVTYALTERVGLFHGYLTQSPYLDTSIGIPLLAKLEASLASNKELDAYFYMNLGNEPNLEAQYVQLETILQGAESPAFEWVSHREQNENHMTTRLKGHYAALETFFASDWPLEISSLQSGGFESLENHINQLSSKYGYNILYSEQIFQQSTQQFLTMQNLPAARQAASLYVAQYETSPLAHFLLGVSLASGGQRDDALTSINTAISLYEQNPNPQLQPVYNQMKQIQMQLGGG